MSFLEAVGLALLVQGSPDSEARDEVRRALAALTDGPVWDGWRFDALMRENERRIAEWLWNTHTVVSSQSSAVTA